MPTVRPWRRVRPRADHSASHVAAPGAGQSIAEFVLILPILLLVMLVAIDFGRIYLGYVNLQQMARVAGAYASLHAAALDTPTDPTVLAAYKQFIANDAAKINCDLPDGAIADPAFPEGHDLGDPIDVAIDCNFHVVTPIVSNILGGVIGVSASATYPVREGAVAEVPGGGGSISIPPTAAFVGSPLSGYAEPDGSGHLAMDVTFTDTSGNAPTSWKWDFGDGGGFTFGEGPHTVHYVCDKTPGETCSFTVSLTVTSGGGSDTITKSDYVTLTVPPDTGPIAEFTGSPQSGFEPLDVQFDFVDVRGGSVTYVGYTWDFGDGSAVDSSGPSVVHTYQNPGMYDVSLTVTDAATGTDTQVKDGYIVVTHKICTVPDFANQRMNDAQGIWEAAGFTTDVSFAAGHGNYLIQSQSIVGGTIDPQPGGCASDVMVGP